MSTKAIKAAANLAGRPNGLPIYTLSSVPGYRIVEVKGLVRGNTIRARNVGQDIIAVFKTLVGGEISEYTKMMAESREQALDRMRAEALERGANAVVGLRILAYGTGVVLEAE